MTSALMQRDIMVERQIVARGVADPRTLAAMRAVPREEFVPDDMVTFAYEDTPLSIGEGQTISQPYIVALMIEALRVKPWDRALEIGAGSGYAAAVLGQLAGEVFAIERHESLAELARRRVNRLGYTNVHVCCDDGTLGCSEHAPYDVIMVSAAGPEVPKRLLSQLAIGGRLIIPVGTDRQTQDLVRIRRTGEHRYEEESLGHVHFVPLIGTERVKNGQASRCALSCRRLRRIAIICAPMVTGRVAKRSRALSDRPRSRESSHRTETSAHQGVIKFTMAG